MTRIVHLKLVDHEIDWPELADFIAHERALTPGDTVDFHIPQGDTERGNVHRAVELAFLILSWLDGYSVEIRSPYLLRVNKL
jgi:exonuclease VII large subunit